MKKILLLSILSTMLSISSQAQEYPRWTFGPKAGLNLSSAVDLADEYKVSTRVGFTAGIFGEYHINNWMGISIEALYSEQGTKAKSDNQGAVSATVSDTKLLLNYINVPIMARFYPTKGMSINVGFQTGIKTKAEYEVEGNEYVAASTTGMWKQVRPVDLAIPMGVSYTFNFGLILDARYTISLTSIMKKDLLDYVQGTNSVFSITAGWRF